MVPITFLTCTKFADLLTTNNALQNGITALNAQYNLSIPFIPNENVVLSSASADLADLSVQLSYPRVCVYPVSLKNAGLEKSRSLSGNVLITADILASADLVNDTDQWIHFYVHAITTLLRASAGSWGDGVFFSGLYDVQFQPPKVGGLGFVLLARLNLNLLVSLS
jgi:hypothetical protein